VKPRSDHDPYPQSWRRGGDAAIRAEEASKAAALLGAELILGNLDDTRIAIGDPTVG